MTPLLLRCGCTGSLLHPEYEHKVLGKPEWPPGCCEVWGCYLRCAEIVPSQKLLGVLWLGLVFRIRPKTPASFLTSMFPFLLQVLCLSRSLYLGLLPGVLQSELLPGIQPRGCAPEGLDKACTVGSPAGMQKGDSRSPCPSWPARRSPVLLNLNFHPGLFALTSWGTSFALLFMGLILPPVHLKVTF